MKVLSINLNKRAHGPGILVTFLPPWAWQAWFYDGEDRPPRPVPDGRPYWRVEFSRWSDPPFIYGRVCGLEVSLGWQ